MFQLPDISESQSTLIQVGVFLQLTAMGIYLYGTGARRHQTHHLDALERAEREELKSQFMEQAKTPRTRRVCGESFDELMGERVKTSVLARTSKVQFRQSLSFRRHGS